MHRIIEVIDRANPTNRVRETRIVREDTISSLNIETNHHIDIIHEKKIVNAWDYLNRVAAKLNQSGFNTTSAHSHAQYIIIKKGNHYGKSNKL